MRVWISVRVSTDEQKDSGAGIAGQLDACRAFAERQAWPIGGEFADEGISGSTGLAKRPALLEAIASMGRGDVLLVAKRDRLGRDLIAVAMIEAAITRKGARVVSVAGEGTEGDDPTAILMRRIIDSFAEYERLVIKARTKTAMQAKRRRGERVGQLPLGHDLADDGIHLIANEAEQSAIARVQDLRSKGFTLQAITDEMNRLKIPAKRGGRWHLKTVHRLVHSTSREGLPTRESLAQ